LEPVCTGFGCQGLQQFLKPAGIGASIIVPRFASPVVQLSSRWRVPIRSGEAHHPHVFQNLPECLLGSEAQFDMYSGRAGRQSVSLVKLGLICADVRSELEPIFAVANKGLSRLVSQDRVKRRGSQPWLAFSSVTRASITTKPSRSATGWRRKAGTRLPRSRSRARYRGRPALEGGAAESRLSVRSRPGARLEGMAGLGLVQIGNRCSASHGQEGDRRSCRGRQKRGSA
jgi:hypothetical protein